MGTTMSLVNIVPRQANCESRLLMIAASTPAISRPISHGLSTSWPTIAPSTAEVFGLLVSPIVGSVNSPAAYNPAAHTPMRMHGTQTMAMQMGCATIASRKLFASFAVSQC